jgi:hypothetical protein
VSPATLAPPSPPAAAPRPAPPAIDANRTVY